MLRFDHRLRKIWHTKIPNTKFKINTKTPEYKEKQNC